MPYICYIYIYMHHIHIYIYVIYHTPTTPQGGRLSAFAGCLQGGTCTCKKMKVVWLQASDVNTFQSSPEYLVFMTIDVEHAPVTLTVAHAPVLNVWTTSNSLTTNTTRISISTYIKYCVGVTCAKYWNMDCILRRRRSPELAPWSPSCSMEKLFRHGSLCQ